MVLSHGVDTLGPDAYFVAALDLLATRGADAVTIGALCERLGVTKGSFYHHFRNQAAFVDDLLASWATTHAAELIHRSEEIADPWERMETLHRIAGSLPHAAEAAIRAWGYTNPAVAAVVAQVDQAREAHIADALAATGVERQRATVMARISVALLVGMQQVHRPASRRDMEEVFAELRRWAGGRRATSGRTISSRTTG
jgi:AcrR family transcriptional regulator